MSSRDEPRRDIPRWIGKSRAALLGTVGILEHWKQTLLWLEQSNRPFFRHMNNWDEVHAIVYCAEMCLEVLDLVEADTDPVDVKQDIEAVVANLETISHCCHVSMLARSKEWLERRAAGSGNAGSIEFVKLF